MTKLEHIRNQMEKLYPTLCTLSYQTPYHLLVAARLAAQCTDVRVNMITPKLFSRYPTPKDMAEADIDELREIIRPCGFYNSKAKDLVRCAKVLLERHGGQLPKTMDELVALPGVGRKTANLILGDCFCVPGIVVDTHCMRLSRRIGLADGNTPEKIEGQLRERVPKDYWIDIGHHFVEHGRAVCKARKPLCDMCSISQWCERKL